MKCIDGTMDINTIIPYKNNPRNNKKAIQYVANSIKEFGFKQPIVVDKNNVIICGHTRFEAAKLLNLKEVPVIIANDLTEKQVKAYRLADNKVAEMAKWDMKALDLELSDLEFDMTEFGFPSVIEERVNERERTLDGYNLSEYDDSRISGYYDMPIIRRTDYVPNNLIGFNYVKTMKPQVDTGVHFFLDDYQFERIWTNPHAYINKLVMWDCVLTPDFSLYLNMPMAMKIWNIYRSRLIGQMLQDYGATVIPTLSWGEPRTFDFCFDGIEQGGTVAVSTIGVKRDEKAMDIWTLGMDKAMEVLKPKTVIVYGGDIGYKFNCDVVYISNSVTERMKNGR